MKPLSCSLICTTLSMLSLTFGYGEPLENRFSAHRIRAEAWLHNGLLFESPHDQIWDYLYCGKDDNLVVVSGLPKFSKMMNEELDAAHPAEKFINTSLPEVARMFFEHSRSCVIDKSYIHERSRIPDWAWDFVHAQKTEIERSLEILRKYEDPRVSIASGQWQSHFYVLLGDGSVVKWDLDGAVRPFSVNHLTKTVVENPGTIISQPPAPGDG
jgi:hypothetical protein